MAPETAGNQHLHKHINRMALVRQLCASPGLSRADLANALGLTKSTVSLLVSELINEGWLVEREIVATGDLGRRPTPLFIGPHRQLIGVEVGIESIRVVLTSLTGEVLASTVADYGSNKSAKACIALIAATLLKLYKQKTDGEHHRVIGIGIGLPGGVDEAHGYLHFASNLGWRDVPFGALLIAKLAGTPLANVPLIVQNEADVAALGELEFNPEQAADPLLFVSINQGVGAGVIVSNRLLTGHRGFAGEVGHVILQVNGPLCTCGRHGCAAALIGMRALLRTPDTAEDELPTASLAELQRRLGAKDARTLRAVKKAGAYLGVLLQNLSAAYDPASIVLGGSIVDLGDQYLQPALQTLNGYATAANLQPPQVRMSRFGVDAVAVGGAALARHRLTRPAMAVGSNGNGAAQSNRASNMS